jgi:hypothetical protein
MWQDWVQWSIAVNVYGRKPLHKTTFWLVGLYFKALRWPLFPKTEQYLLKETGLSKSFGWAHGQKWNLAGKCPMLNSAPPAIKINTGYLAGLCTAIYIIISLDCDISIYVSIIQMEDAMIKNRNARLGVRGQFLGSHCGQIIPRITSPRISRGNRAWFIPPLCHKPVPQRCNEIL